MGYPDHLACRGQLVDPHADRAVVEAGVYGAAIGVYEPSAHFCDSACQTACLAVCDRHPLPHRRFAHLPGADRDDREIEAVCAFERLGDTGLPHQVTRRRWLVDDEGGRNGECPYAGAFALLGDHPRKEAGPVRLECTGQLQDVAGWKVGEIA
jgi:hypothetical protein